MRTPLILILVCGALAGTALSPSPVHGAATLNAPLVRKDVPSPASIIYEQGNLGAPPAGAIELGGLQSWGPSLIYDQGNLGSSTANAMAAALRYISCRGSAQPTNFTTTNPECVAASRLFLYWNSRFLESVVMPSSGINVNADTGDSTVGAVLATEKFGFCPESAQIVYLKVTNSELTGTAIFNGWPYSDNSSQYKKQPDPLCYSIALDDSLALRPAGAGEDSAAAVNPYARLQRRLQHADLASRFRKPNWRTQNTAAEKSELLGLLQAALKKDHPVVAGLYLDNSFYNASTTGFVPLPNLSTFYPVGGHVLVIVGYGAYRSGAPNEKYFKALNSWGQWGNRGFLYFPAEYVLNANVFQAEMFELWADGAQVAPTMMPGEAKLGGAGGSGSFAVTGAGDEAWTASASEPWIHSSSTGTGSGTVNYTVDANPGASYRSGEIQVGGGVFRLTQGPAGTTWNEVFGWLAEGSEGWSHHDGLGWLWFQPGGPWIWSTSLQGWLAVTHASARELWSPQYRWLTLSESDPTMAHSSALGWLHVGRSSDAAISEGWAVSDCFGYVWPSGDGAWFYTTGYDWLGVPPDGGIWCPKQNGFLDGSAYQSCRSQ